MSTLIKNARLITATHNYYADIFIDGKIISVIGKNLPMPAIEADLMLPRNL